MWEAKKGSGIRRQESADKSQEAAAGSVLKKAAPSVLTVVKARRMVYTEQDHLAHYTGGVQLARPGLDLKAAELKTWLAEPGSESRLERAFADGSVQIVQTSPARTRTGTGQHAEYYTEDQKIILRGGQPVVVDSRDGSTQGVQLTYFANDDRLLVNGAPDRPATSRTRRK
jgi:lipopolysaccharide export system protein LptA